MFGVGHPGAAVRRVTDETSSLKGMSEKESVPHHNCELSTGGLSLPRLHVISDRAEKSRHAFQAGRVEERAEAQAASHGHITVSHGASKLTIIHRLFFGFRRCVEFSCFFFFF
ncbi:hypothetical protein MHYP_G00082680 [Metynnis hypsauchen]